MSDLGINASPIDTDESYRVGWQNLLFKIDEKFYAIDDEGGEISGIKKLVHLLKDDELNGYGGGVFTYIIGTEYIIDVQNKTITRNYLSNMCDINKMHIWLKPASTIQEIESKHGIIMQELVDNYNTIINKFQLSENLDEMLLHDNAIDQLYYAGEILYEQNADTLRLNFLSGTFMSGIIDCSNPPQQVIDCITNFFKNKMNIQNIIVDTSCKTYINKIMTLDQLNTYVNSGVKAYVFDNLNDAQLYKNKPRDLGKIESKKRIVEAMLRRIPTDEINLKNLEDLNAQIATIKAFVPTRYVPQSFGGKKYTFKNHKKRTTKYKKRQYTFKKHNKRTRK
jgi:hypothetical protein